MKGRSQIGSVVFRQMKEIFFQYFKVTFLINIFTYITYIE